MATRQETMAEMDRRADLFRTVFYVALILGLIGAAVLGWQVGRSTTSTTGSGGLLYNTETTSHSTEGWLVFAGTAVSVFVVTLPLLGISWLLEGQASLLDRHHEEPTSD